MAVLGVTEHQIAGLPDGDLAAQAAAGVAWVGRLLDDVRPATIVTFGADGMTFHPDHIEVHRWVTQAWRERGRPGRLLYATPTAEHLARFGARFEEWGVYMGDERPIGVPSEQLAVHVRLRGWALDRKVAALRAMATQTGDAIAGLGLETYAELNAEEAFVAAAPRTRHQEHHMFTAADGAGLHDGPVVPQCRNEVVFDCLDDVLR